LRLDQLSIHQLIASHRHCCAPLTPSGGAIKRGVKRGRCVIEITVTWSLILPTPAEMRVSGSENFQNWRRIGFYFFQDQKIERR